MIPRDRIERFAAARRLAGRCVAAFLHARQRTRRQAMLHTLAWRPH